MEISGRQYPRAIACTQDQLPYFSLNSVSTLLKQGGKPEEIGIVVRSKSQMKRAIDAAQKSGSSYTELNVMAEPSRRCISVCTMHLCKGLEFRIVIIMACDDEVIPLQQRIENISDESDLAEVYTTERHLLYVACTRARDQLLITSIDPASEFLDDFQEP